MAEQLFIRILNMSLTGSFVTLIVWAIRFFLRKAPSIFSYCLWAVVLFRLLCPISFSADFSLFNALPAPFTEHGRIAYISENILENNRFPMPVTTPESESSKGYDRQNADASAGTPDFSKTALILKTAAGIWQAGILIMALYSIGTMMRLKEKLKSAAQVRDNIYISEKIATPFVIGIIHPRIYLPSGLSEKETEYILLHEQIHLKRKDHLLKTAAYATLCLHWFNPLVWAAFFLCGKDMEMSCDEAVIRKIGNGVKKEYSASLLCLSTGKRIVNGIPLAFGEGETGSRIRNILQYKKPAALAFLFTTVVCIAAAVILLANPEPAEEETGGAYITFYGIITDIVWEGTSRRLLVCPGIGEMEIPEAENIDTYFEPGDERNPHELLPGDLAAITFSADEDVSILETWPARFSVSAESILVLWQGLSLENTGNGSYLFTFPGGVVPDAETAKLGDTLSLYWEESEDRAYLTQTPESESSELIASVSILAVDENEYGASMLTIELSLSDIQQILSGFGFHIRFSLEQNTPSAKGSSEHNGAADSALPSGDFGMAAGADSPDGNDSADSTLPSEDFGMAAGADSPDNNDSADSALPSEEWMEHAFSILKENFLLELESQQ